MRVFSVLSVPVLAAMSVPAIAQEGSVIEAEALFQSCGSHQWGQGCMFHTEGMSYLASETAQTDKALLERLATVAPGTPMRIAGEVAFDFSDTGLLFLRMTSAEPGGDDPHAGLRGQLQGEWVFADDPAYGLRVEGTEWKSLYGGQVLGSAVLWIAEGCPAPATSGLTGLIIRSEFDIPGQHPCFDLVEFSPDRMVLQQAGDPELSVWTRP
jgi:hypothetical protein